MLDFGLFSDARKQLKLAEGRSKNRPFGQIKENGGESAIAALIAGCTRDTVIRLMEYFDREAPVQALLKERLREFSESRTEEGMEKYIRQSRKETPSFYQYLVSLMEKKGFHTDAELYSRIGMSRQTFAKLRKNQNAVSRNHALLIAAGMELDYTEASELLEKAGYAFRNTEMREVIISYVMRNRKYTLEEMDEILLSFGEKPLTDCL